MVDKKVLTRNLRLIENYPYDGVIYCDSSTLFTDADCLEEMVSALYEEYKDTGITKVVGSEAKGFIVGSILASRLHVGFVMARKAGILPYDTIGEDYVKNGTERRQEIHTDTLNENDVVLLHDDVLGTGATMNAIHRLVKRLGVKQTYISFVVELGALHGRENLPEGVDVKTMLRLN